MAIDPKYLTLAFREAEVADAQLVHHSAGVLALPSGRLVACDPFLFSGAAEAFELPLPIGRYPVTLVVAKWKDDQRIAFARLDLGGQAPVDWHLMTIAGQDLTTLGSDEIFGYPVDAGTGCFADAQALQALDRLMGSDPDYWERLSNEMQKTYVHTWSWVNWPLTGDLNVVAFSSGVGDGVYATYAGIADDGQIVAVVTDFGVLPL